MWSKNATIINPNVNHHSDNSVIICLIWAVSNQKFEFWPLQTAVQRHLWHGSFSCTMKFNPLIFKINKIYQKVDNNDQESQTKVRLIHQYILQNTTFQTCCLWMNKTEEVFISIGCAININDESYRLTTIWPLPDDFLNK